MRPVCPRRASPSSTWWPRPASAAWWCGARWSTGSTPTSRSPSGSARRRPLCERPDALARLAHRYLLGHAPASDRDLAKWAGITLGDARLGLRSLADQLVDGPAGVALVSTAPTTGPLPPPRLLGAFDPLLHGWVSRELFVGDRPGVVTTNGIFRPVALAGGRVVATWTMPGGVVTIEPLAPLTRAVRRGLAEDAADVLRYLGLEPRPVVVG